jgi:TM2 domain-containing membrane protein YozV
MTTPTNPGPDGPNGGGRPVPPEGGGRPDGPPLPGPGDDASGGPGFGPPMGQPPLDQPQYGEPTYGQAPYGQAPQGQPYGYQPYADPHARSRVVAGVLGILLGGLGIHRFYLGYTWIGILQIVVTILTFGLGHLWGLVEGVLYLVSRTGYYSVDADGRPLTN